MAILKRRGTTYVVNAAFLQEVKESNFELWSLFREIRELHPCGWDTQQSAHRFVEKLTELRDAIGLQFTLEETYGFIEGLPPVSAIGVASAETARTQHKELYLQIHEICEKVEEAQYRGTIARDMQEYANLFVGFDSSFRAHEELEQELIRCGLGISQLKL